MVYNILIYTYIFYSLSVIIGICLSKIIKKRKTIYGYFELIKNQKEEDSYFIRVMIPETEKVFNSNKIILLKK